MQVIVSLLSPGNILIRLIALQSWTTTIVTNILFTVHTWPSRETSSPRARKNTKDLVGIVFSRVVRSSEIQVEEHPLSLFPPASLSTLYQPLSLSLSLSLSSLALVSWWISRKRGQRDGGDPNRILRIPADVRTITGPRNRGQGKRALLEGRLET